MLSLSGELFTVWEPFNHLVPVPFFLPQNPLKRHFHRIRPEETKAMRRFIGGKLLLDIKRNQPRPPGLLGPMVKVGNILSTGLGYLAGRRKPLFKDPIALMSAEWMAEEFDARVVLLARHPAAYVASVKRLSWRTPLEDFTSQRDLLDWLPEGLAEELLARVAQRPEPPEGVFDLVDAVLCWKVHHHAVFRYSTEHPNWILVRHEDLAMRYLEGFENLYRRLGLSWSKDRAREVEDHCSPTNRVVRGEVVHEFRQDSRSVIRAWMDALDDRERDTIARLASPVWERFYSSGSWMGNFADGRGGHSSG